MTSHRSLRAPSVRVGTGLRLMAGILALCSFGEVARLVAAPAAPPAKKVWPETLRLDSVAHNATAWRNDDAGKLTFEQDPDTGKPYLKWTATDDGIGHLVFTALRRAEIDFSQYDLLRFRYRIAGKPVNNLNPIIQQYPFNHGFRALFYAIDNLDVRLGEWRSFTLDLRMLENSWPDTFSPTQEEFQFEVLQEAGAGFTEVSLGDLVLLKNVLSIRRSYAGEWQAAPEGGQRWLFHLPVRNGGTVPLTVQVASVAATHPRFTVVPAPALLALAPGQEAMCAVTVTIPAAAVQAKPPFYGEMVELEFAAADQPDLRLSTQLPCGIRGPARHPSILCTAERSRELREAYADPERRKTLDPLILRVVSDAKRALEHRPVYPPCGNRAAGFNLCLVDKTPLAAAPMPNLPEPSYQCPLCGRFYRGMFYQAAMEDWCGLHMRNAEAVQRAGIAYMMTGDAAYAAKAAEILRGYIDTYLKLPVAAGSGVHTQIACSGATRIGGSFMQEQNWLTNLAVGLDCIRGSDALTAEDLRGIRDRVFVPSANLMMDHHVGLMNLQWMIDRAGVFAGLAAEAPDLVARAVYYDHGIVAQLEQGFLADGFWRENPSYINVMANEGYPVLGTLFQEKILPYTPEMDRRYKSMWFLAAPDDRFPTLGTGGPAGLSLLFNGVKAIARHSRDPEIAWIDRQKPFVTQMGMYFSSIAAAFQAQGTLVPADQVKPIQPVTTSFPDYGVAVLRTPQTDLYSALAFGRHLIHGHYNKMSVNAYGKGGWFLRNVWGGYGEGFADYLEATASSSTVMVDGKRQDADTGELLFIRSTPLAEIAGAREKGAWKDVEHRRTVVQTGTWLLMLDHCIAGNEHTYDWLYHGQQPGKGNELSWAAGPTLKGPVVSLGDEPCYPFFLPAEETDANGAWLTVRYARPDGSSVRLRLLNEGDGNQLFRTQSKNWKHEGLVHRRRGTSVRFAALFEPLAKGEEPQATLELLALTDAATGKPLAWPQAQAFAVSAGGKTLAVVSVGGNLKVRLPGGVAVPGTDPVTVLELP